MGVIVVATGVVARVVAAVGDRHVMRWGGDRTKSARPVPRSRPPSVPLVAVVDLSHDD